MAKGYEKEGKDYPRVTSVLAVRNMDWKVYWLASLVKLHGKMAFFEMQRKSTEATKIGSAVHEFIDNYFSDTTGD